MRVELHQDDESDPPSSTALRPLPPPAALDLRASPAVAASPRLRVHAYTIPAFGHYQTLKGVVLALAARGHNVTLMACDRTRGDAERDGLLGGVGSHGGVVEFQGLGACGTYDARDAALGALIAGHADGARGVFQGMARLGREMADAAMAHYTADPAAHLPHAIVFDGDTYAAMDVSVAWRIPRVARVGTGLRDVFTSPLYAPSYSSGVSVGLLAGTQGLSHDSLGVRLFHGALVAFSRFLIAPILLPWLYSGNRRAALTSDAAAAWRKQQLAAGGAAGEVAEGGEGGAEGRGGASSIPSDSVFENRLRSAAPIARARGGAALDESHMRADLPWDGVPTLYNTHWGLEHARPTAPYEHLIGHTNDFVGDASRPLDPTLRAWLDLADAPPVVYVGLGTLSVLPPAWTESIASALTASPHFRFIWSVAPAQAAALPVSMRLATARARCALTLPANGFAAATDALPVACASVVALEAEMGVTPLPPRSAAAAVASGAVGSVLLVDWAPQLAVLLHPAVVAFVTHGGMNGIAEGTYARLPLLCMPLFSDQPDNCAHAADKGFAAVAHVMGGLNASHFHAQLHALVGSAAAAAAVQEAWVHNCAAGGAAAAVSAVEAAAALPYGAHLAAVVPAYHWAHPIMRYNLDYAAFVVVVLTVLVALLRFCVRGCAMRRASFAPQAAGEAGNGKAKAA